MVFLLFCFCFVPMGIFPMGNSGRFPQGKPAATESSNSAFINYQPSVCYFCVSIPPAVRPFLLRQMDMVSLTCAHIWVRAVHTKWGEAHTSLHKSWLGGTEQLPATLTRTGDRTQGLRIWIPTHWPLSFVPRTVPTRIRMDILAPTPCFIVEGNKHSTANKYPLC